MDHNPDLTSSELAAIWSSYMGDSLNVCVMKHFLKTVADEEIKEVIQFSKSLSEKHLDTLRSIFEKENIPIPQGYSDSDVNELAPKLFSDIFYLRYLQMMGRNGAQLNGTVLGTTYRDDIREFYTGTTSESVQLYNKVVDLMKAKGVLIRSPYIAYNSERKFVDDPTFFVGHFMKKKRPLLAVEITHLANNIEMNYVGRTLVDGFAQVVHSKEIREHMQEGYILANEIINTLEKFLKMEHISTPVSPDSNLSNSTVAPFSEKLMLGVNTMLSAISIGSLGLGVGASVRSDLITEYAQLIVRVGRFSVDTGNIAIKHRWLEKPPQLVDREKLQNTDKK
ncbi:hypothetical protein HNQ94_000168 [Salirhabdus euzebyi]|uniref:DUF3231 family protein n=1 Tax=Salirhabdus euzebyi TaxID=394506 RepID=A0A841PS40_9BACI|nr:DUF3231 family protein [Salirhabdus euzebyi]MBB6451747.1 hypothetical protein [Salirhabdus euzebyi]